MLFKISNLINCMSIKSQINCNSITLQYFAAFLGGFKLFFTLIVSFQKTFIVTFRIFTIPTLFLHQSKRECRILTSLSL